MGAPELPGDAGDENLRPTQQIFHAQDDSDNESMEAADNAYAYYQPLDNNEVPYDNSLMDDESDDQLPQLDDLGAVAVTTPQVPPIETTDVQLERQVWNEPRPQALQIELDNTKTAQILNAMANFTLPNVAVPEWAVGVPEENWKEELLQRIRQRKESHKPVATLPIKYKKD